MPGEPSQKHLLAREGEFGEHWEPQGGILGRIGVEDLGNLGARTGPSPPEPPKWGILGCEKGLGDAGTPGWAGGGLRGVFGVQGELRMKIFGEGAQLNFGAPHTRPLGPLSTDFVG